MPSGRSHPALLPRRRQPPEECLFSFICSSNNNIPRIVKMLTALRTKYGTPLCNAAENGHIDVVELLLRRGADPDLESGTGSSRLSPLEWCLEPVPDEDLVPSMDEVSTSCLAALLGANCSSYRFPSLPRRSAGAPTPRTRRRCSMACGMPWRAALRGITGRSSPRPCTRRSIGHDLRRRALRLRYRRVTLSCRPVTQTK